MLQTPFTTNFSLLRCYIPLPPSAVTEDHSEPGWASSTVVPRMSTRIVEFASSITLQSVSASLDQGVGMTLHHGRKVLRQVEPLPSLNLTMWWGDAVPEANNHI
jgi:hypothetical protein